MMFLSLPKALKVIVMMVVVMVVMVVMGLAACGANQSPAPTQTVTTIAGQTMTFSNPKHYTLVNFWATSCATCVEEMPTLAALHQKYQAQGFRVIAIAMSYDRPDYVLNFSQKNALPFAVALDVDEKHAQSFGGIVGTPTSFLINPQGQIIKRYIGKPDFVELEALIQSKG